VRALPREGKSRQESDGRRTIGQREEIMKILTSTTSPLQQATPALVVGCFEDERDGLFKELDAALDGLLQRMLESGEFRGKSGTSRLIHSFGKLPAERLLLVGLGKKEEFDTERLREASGEATQALKSARIASFSSTLQRAGEGAAALEATCEGALLASYSFDDYKTKEKEERFRFEAMTVLVSEPAAEPDAQQTVDRCRAACRGVVTARNLVSHPGNVVTPGRLAETARELAQRCGLTCRVLEPDELEKLGMNALLSVGKGSAEPPRLIVLEWAGSKGSPTVLIGKGITFDSGGISLKPGAGMEQMKTDMAGAAAVLGTLEAIALQKLPVHVIGIIPTAENMPGSKAYKPGDIIKSMSGTTIEITNTDAEGRLILCDALHYAVSTYSPTALIDVATLTGACVVALGHEATGVMGNDQQLVDELKRAGELTGERLWQLPVWDSYGEAMKSDVADLKNAGSRDGGAILAAWFLKQFVGSTRWAHLDIAGTAWAEKTRPYVPKGATGVGVRLLLKYLRPGTLPPTCC
jgi:leucyl aminopeptidase